MEGVVRWWGGLGTRVTEYLRRSAGQAAKRLLTAARSLECRITIDTKHTTFASRIRVC